MKQPKEPSTADNSNSVVDASFASQVLALLRTKHAKIAAISLLSIGAALGVGYYVFNKWNQQGDEQGNEEPIPSAVTPNKYLVIGTGENGRRTLGQLLSFSLSRLQSGHDNFNRVFERYSQQLLVNLLDSVFKLGSALAYLQDESKHGEILCEQDIRIDLKKIGWMNMPVDEELTQIKLIRSNFIKTEELLLKIQNFFSRQDVKLLLRNYHHIFQTAQQGSLPEKIDFILNTNFSDLQNFPKQMVTENGELARKLFFQIRTKLVGIEEKTFNIKNSKGIPITTSIWLAGGQRSERKKWANVFGNVDNIIFCINLSEYNKTMYEDDSMLRYEDTMDVFRKIGNMTSFGEHTFQSTTIVVFTFFDQMIRQIYYGQPPTLSLFHKMAEIASKGFDSIPAFLSTCDFDDWTRKYISFLLLGDLNDRPENSPLINEQPNNKSPSANMLYYDIWLNVSTFGQYGQQDIRKFIVNSHT